MKLAEYLADYIEHEREKQGYEFDCFMSMNIIQQGIEAFVSTEGKHLVVFEAGGQVTVERYV